MLHKTFESFNNSLNEAKVTYKRRYTENHPAKKIYGSTKVRAKILEAIGERKISKMAFERILRELNANPRYGYRNRNLFQIEEDTVSLSSKGMKMLKVSKVNESLNEARTKNISFKVNAKHANDIEALLIDLQDNQGAVEGWDWSEPNDYKRGTMKLVVETPKKQADSVESELTSKTYKFDIELSEVFENKKNARRFNNKGKLGINDEFSGNISLSKTLSDELGFNLKKEFTEGVAFDDTSIYDVATGDTIAADALDNKHSYDELLELCKKWYSQNESTYTHITESSQSHLITEGTRSHIGIILPNGKVEAAYCHYDGYPEHNGEMLKKHYTNPKTVKELMNLAANGISALDKSIKGGPNHSFATPTKGETIFYGRDRGENHDMILKFKDADDYLKNAPDEFAYLYNPKTRQWSYADIYNSKEWIVLESNIFTPELIMPINEKVSRYKGMSKVAKTLIKLFDQDRIFNPTNNNFTQSGKNNLYITLYILLEALTDANFHSDRSAIERPLKKYMKFVNMDLDPSEISGLTLQTANVLNIGLSLKKSHAQNYGENVYSKISSAGDWSGPAIAYGVCLYLESYGDTAAGALAASEIIKQQFSQEFPLPKELS
tara:strand:+ start:7853 stop:9679 length:1827 start_codon:yes stop_codon:yes gene_type:complete